MSEHNKRAIGIFGGTFDPVHKGHIAIAQDIQQHLQLDEMRLLPCRLPPHRNRPSASDADRLQMLRLATEGTSLQIDEQELKREGLSYSFDTLLALRNKYGRDRPLILCMGFDAFADFNHWHRWQEIPQLAHIVVATRVNHSSALNSDVGKLLAEHQTKAKNDLRNSPAGKIYLTQLSQIPVSSTSIRKALSQADHKITELNPKVQQFIQQRGLYRP